MSEDLVVRQCAPTLANLKTGSLFVCPITERHAFYSSLRSLNGILVPKGLRVLPLRIRDHSALIYLYRPSRLEKDLQDPAARRILEAQGYPARENCLPKLMERVRQSPEFPHEIGLFLGYPPEDVQGFLENRPCKCTGCWKVYGDVAQAKKTFAAYKKCQRVYCHQLAKGTDMNRLTVADPYTISWMKGRKMTYV